MTSFKKRLAIILAVCLVVVNTVPAFAAVDNEPQTDLTEVGTVLEEDTDIEIASPSNAGYKKTALEDDELNDDIIPEKTDGEELPEDEEEEFFAEVKVGNVIITAKAEAGVVPKGTILKAKKVVDKETKEAIDEIVEEKREDEAQVIESLKFDIQLIYNGEEIEPNGPVSIDFVFADAAANAEVNVYHILEDEDTKELVEAEVLEVETTENPEAVKENADEGKTPLLIETEVPSFSYYVVEFTYNGLTYELPGTESVQLSEILAYVGIAASAEEAKNKVTNVEISNTDLFSAEKDGDDWTVISHKSFTSEEWMNVKFNGLEYKIVVTDPVSLTVAEVLALAKTTFPITKDTGWLMSDGEGTAYYYNNELLFDSVNDWQVLHIDTTKTVAFIDTCYRYAESYKTVDFELEGEELVRITVNWTGDLARVNGTYKPACKVSYDGNGATSGTPWPDTRFASGKTVTVREKPYTLKKDGYTFNGWNTQADGKGIHYDAGKTFTITANTTLYAQWEAAPTPTIKITSNKTEYKVGETIDLTITITGMAASTEIKLKDGVSFDQGVPIDSTGKGKFHDSSKTAAGTYKYKAYVKEKPDIYGEVTVTVKGSDTPDPKKKKSSSSSSSLFTGTWNNAVSNGNWTQDASGVWHYASTQTFRSTWGYIVNPYAGGQPEWFYFDANGNMLTGWQFIQGKWYYLNPSKDGTLGACQLGGVTPDGWTVDENGAWVESIPRK